MAFTEAAARGALNNTTVVDMLTNGGSGRYVVAKIVVYNKDISAITVTIQTNDGTARPIWKETLNPGEALPLDGPYILAAAEKLQAVLAANVAANQPTYEISYANVT